MGCLSHTWLDTQIHTVMHLSCRGDPGRRVRKEMVYLGAFGRPYNGELVREHDLLGSHDPRGAVVRHVGQIRVAHLRQDVSVAQLAHAPGELLHASVQVHDHREVHLGLQARRGADRDAGALALDAQVSLFGVEHLLLRVVLGD